MGYYAINNLIKERINNMSNVIKEMQTISLKQMDCINKNADNLNQLAAFVKTLQDNVNLLAERIAKLEKKLGMYERPSN